MRRYTSGFYSSKDSAWARIYSFRSIFGRDSGFPSAAASDKTNRVVFRRRCLIKYRRLFHRRPSGAVLTTAVYFIGDLELILLDWVFRSDEKRIIIMLYTQIRLREEKLTYISPIILDSQTLRFYLFLPKPLTALLWSYYYYLILLLCVDTEWLSRNRDHHGWLQAAPSTH